jgi:hypothetical protein
LLVYILKRSNLYFIHRISCFSRIVINEFIAKGEEIVHKVG